MSETEVCAQQETGNGNKDLKSHTSLFLFFTQYCLLIQIEHFMYFMLSYFEEIGCLSNMQM